MAFREVPMFEVRVNRPGFHKGSVVCVFAGSAEMV